MASQDSSAKMNNDYVNQLMEEKKALNPQLSLAYKLLQKEIDRACNPESGNDLQRSDNHIIVHSGKQIRIKVKIHIPIDEHPNFNFVGKLLGPKGSSLQQLQEATQTRMAILGKGSMRDKRKEEECRTGGDPKYSHLNDELHVEVTAFAPAPEAYRRVSLACAELQRFLVPDTASPFNQGQDFYDGPPQSKPPFAGEGHAQHMAQRGGPQRPMAPPMGREPPRRAPMVQSTYATPEADEWTSPRVTPRRGGFNSAPAAQRPAARGGYEEPANDYNSYGDGYGEYNSGTTSSYYDYSAEAEPTYADGYGVENNRGPMRNSGGAPRGGRGNARAQSHPYAGATRRGY